MRSWRGVLWVLALSWPLAGTAVAAQPSRTIWPKPLDVAQGEIVEVKVAGADLLAVQGRLGDEPIRFFPMASESFAALVGVDLEAKPGPIKLLLEATTRKAGHKKKEIILRIKPKLFPKESFKVSEEFDQLSEEVLARIRRERDQFTQAFKTSSRERLWEGSFVEPVAGEISSPFGLRRIINGTPRAPHSGADLRAAMGTPVLAANHGRVVLRGDFFYSGKSLVLDHGGGLFTMYFHLAELHADEQALVRTSDVIALSGMSGRVTGPHLHWGARINNARVDPFQLILRTSASGTSAPKASSMADGPER